MARQSATADGASDDLGKLKGDIEKLRADLSALTRTMKSVGNSAVADVQSMGMEKLEELRSDLERATGHVRRQGEASVAEIEKAVQERPLMSLLAAFGAGMLLARLIGRT
ncbi:MAG: DUF883 family protein [Rhizobiales bacterium]|nr:DUF883 family protein [Hyphomicrobiales bacterium]